MRNFIKAAVCMVAAVVPVLVYEYIIMPSRITAERSSFQYPVQSILRRVSEDLGNGDCGKAELRINMLLKVIDALETGDGVSLEKQYHQILMEKPRPYDEDTPPHHTSNTKHP